MTREFLNHEAEVYAASVPEKSPGESIVRVEMDDGWSVSIKEAEKPTIAGAIGRSGDLRVRKVIWAGPETDTHTGSVKPVVGMVEAGGSAAGIREYDQMLIEYHKGSLIDHWQEKPLYDQKELAIFRAREIARYIKRPEEVTGPQTATQKIFAALDSKGKDKKPPLERKMGREWPSH